MSSFSKLAPLALVSLTACALFPGDEIDPPPSARAVQVVTGRLHTCALTDKQRVRCWGVTRDGQVGTDDPRFYEGPESDSFDLNSTPNTPIELELENVSAISSSSQADFNCAIVAGGEVRCWGLDDMGQLGTGIAYTDSRDRKSPKPVPVAGLSGIRQIAVGGAHACALTATGGVMCWGSNDVGQLGDGSPIGDGIKSPFKNAPVAVPGVSGATAIAAGSSHTCAITSGGGLTCWGSNEQGESGGDALVEGHPAVAPTPVNVSGLSSGVARITLGVLTTCAVMTSGELRCFGRGLGMAEGKLTFPDPIAVTAIPELAPIDSVSLELFASHVSCAVVGGAVRCWGSNEHGCLGVDPKDEDGDPDYGYVTYAPKDVVGLGSGARDVQVGSGHVCALMKDGAVKCWGDMITGNGDSSSLRIPAQKPQSVVSLP